MKRQITGVALLLAVTLAACAAMKDTDAGKPLGYGGSSFTPHENLEIKTGIPPGVVPAAGTVNYTGIDREEYRQALVACTITDLTVGTTLTINVDESDVVGSGYTAVSGATFTAFTPTRDLNVFYGSLDLRGRKQFLRLTEVAVGTFTGNRGCSFILLAPTSLPTAWSQATADFNVK